MNYKDKTPEELVDLIGKMCRKINIPGFDKDDIMSEAMVSLMEYFNECVEKDVRPSEGAIRNVIRRSLYRLIRNNVTFEGCIPKSQEARRSINIPITSTLHQDNCSYDNAHDETGDLFDIMEDRLMENQESIIMSDLVDKFLCLLTPTERAVCGKMLQGYGKPREICFELHGTKDMNMAKAISNHSAKIRSKFKKFWLEETGKIICQ